MKKIKNMNICFAYGKKKVWKLVFYSEVILWPEVGLVAQQYY